MFEQPPSLRSADLRILTHHIYEYKKGLRLLALHTMHAKERLHAKRILERREVPHFIQTVSFNKINIFMGSEDSIAIVRSFGKDSLTSYTPEQDFMLGIMLGYGRSQQLKRYLQFSERTKTQNK